MGQARSAAARGLCDADEARRRCALDPLLVRRLSEHIVALEASPRIFSPSSVFSFGGLLRFLARAFGRSDLPAGAAAFRAGAMASARFPSLGLKVARPRRGAAYVLLFPAGAPPLPVHVSLRDAVSGRREDDALHFRFDAEDGGASRVGGLLAWRPEPARGPMVARAFAEETTAAVEAQFGPEAARRWGLCLADMDTLFAAAWRETAGPGDAARRMADDADAQLLLALQPVAAPPEARREWREAGGGRRGREEGAEAEQGASAAAAAAVAALEPGAESEQGAEAESEHGAEQEVEAGEAGAAAEQGVEVRGRQAREARGAGQKVRAGAGAEVGPAALPRGAGRAAGASDAAAAFAAWLGGRRRAAAALGLVREDGSAARGISWLEFLCVFGALALFPDLPSRLRAAGAAVGADAEGLPVYPPELGPALLDGAFALLRELRAAVRGPRFEVRGGDRRPARGDAYVGFAEMLAESDAISPAELAEAARKAARGAAGGEEPELVARMGRLRAAISARLDDLFAHVPRGEWAEVARQAYLLRLGRSTLLVGVLTEALPTTVLARVIIAPGGVLSGLSVPDVPELPRLAALVARLPLHPEESAGLRAEGEGGQAASLAGHSAEAALAAAARAEERGPPLLLGDVERAERAAAPAAGSTLGMLRELWTDLLPIFAALRGLQGAGVAARIRYVILLQVMKRPLDASSPERFAAELRAMERRIKEELLAALRDPAARQTDRFSVAAREKLRALKVYSDTFLAE